MERGVAGNMARVGVIGTNLALQVSGGPSVQQGTAARADVVAVTFDRSVLDCPLCSSPLKPPVFQCGARHTACFSCHAKLHGNNMCPTCGGGVYEHNHVLDTFVLAAKVHCPYEAFGCRTSVPYCWLADHQLVCRHKPSTCPELGCGFVGLPSLLLPHLVTHHAWPVTRITCGRLHVITIPAVERRRLLVSAGAESVFILASDERGDGGRSVSLACVQARAAAAGPQYKFKVWTQAPADPVTGFKDTLMLDGSVRVCAAPGLDAAAAAAADDATVMAVPPSMLHGDSMEMILRIRIEKIRKRSLGQASASTSASAAAPSF